MMPASKISACFTEKEWSVAAVLALGFDAAAREGALSVGGHAVAVLSHGLHEAEFSAKTVEATEETRALHVGFTK